MYNSVRMTHQTHQNAFDNLSKKIDKVKAQTFTRSEIEKRLFYTHTRDNFCCTFFGSRGAIIVY